MIHRHHDKQVKLGQLLAEAERLIASGYLDRAASLYERACRYVPGEPHLHHILGLVRLSQGALHQAISSFEQAVAINPDEPQWWRNLGAAYLQSGATSRAIQSFQRALSLNSGNAGDYVYLAAALRTKGDFEAATDFLKQALTISPYHAEAIANLCLILQQTCRWGDLATAKSLLDEATHWALNTSETPTEHPLFNIRRSSDITLNQAVARAWSFRVKQRAIRAATPFTHKDGRARTSRITLGYLSFDFRDHPVAHQLLPLFGLHDRNRFKVIAFSMGPDDDSTYRRKIKSDCDAFIDIHSADTAQAARKIHEHGVDILVDLMGHTQNNRMEILALRPAPIQVGYLGFLASSGADFIDYLIADPVVVPESHHCFYNEKLIRMPHCYQMNHTLFLNKSTPGQRSEWGLPEDRFVFCCFNKVYKIDSPVFSNWMDILGQVPESVLWLYNDNAAAVANLKSEARRYGIDQHRLIFSTKCALPRHIERLQIADLVLDTVSYNGGATTSNALQAGVPVLTLMGNHWASRMSASHLLALGMPELVVKDLKTYVQHAVALAKSPDKLKRIRWQLKQNISIHSLFDPRGFVHNLEDAYSYIHQRYRNGEPPVHYNVHDHGAM
jgi:protein O-GlcNAc transferase